MLKANEGLDNLRILLPMVTAIDELRAARLLIGRCHAEVLSEGFTAPLPDIGVMIEVPAAVYLAGPLAQEADFLSVGSNDLTQYLLAVDRGNARVAALYQALHLRCWRRSLTLLKPLMVRTSQSVFAVSWQATRALRPYWLGWDSISCR